MDQACSRLNCTRAGCSAGVVTKEGMSRLSAAARGSRTVACTAVSASMAVSRHAATRVKRPRTSSRQKSATTPQTRDQRK